MTPRPEWTDRNDHDPGIALLELFAYLGDALSYYQDAIAAEARLRTRRRVAIGLAIVGLLAWYCRRE
jgi:hypothetical protein